MEACDRISTSLQYESVREIGLPGQVIALINFLGKKNICLYIFWRAFEW